MFAFGCATPRMYEGPNLPKEQVATIKVSRSHWLYFPPAFFGVSGIDVLSTEDKQINPLVNKLITRIEVLPGFHKVFVHVRKEVWAGSNWTGRNILKLPAEYISKQTLDSIIQNIKNMKPL